MLIYRRTLKPIIVDAIRHVRLRSLDDGRANRMRDLRTFEKGVRTKIRGPIIGETMGNRPRRYDKELYDTLELAPET